MSDGAEPTHISDSCPTPDNLILQAAWNHDVEALKPLLDLPGKASVQDPITGETPLHSAIRRPTTYDNDATSAPTSDERTIATVRELFFAGAIWNDVNADNETPGCLALRLGHREDLYKLCVEAGVRAEMLFALMDGYEALSSGDEDEEMGEEEEVETKVEETETGTAAENGDNEVRMEDSQNGHGVETPSFVPPKHDAAEEVKSEKYLRSKLTYSDGKLVDDDGNGVMMVWETDIMRQSVDALLPDLEPGKRILNIGFGMGIIDTMFAATKPARHHIIEAHPEVLARLKAPGSKATSFWEQEGADEGAFQIHEGKWQDICPKLLEGGEVYDAIYFDTFGEDYGQLRMFFTEYVPGLLDENGCFGFFNGLGADRRICYDVYTKVVEMHLADAGLDVEFTEVDVDMKAMEEAGKGEWEGVKRRYWTLDKYRLPVCTFLG